MDNSILLYSDVIQMNDVRERIESELHNHSCTHSYSFDSIPQSLYKYSKFETFVVDNIETDTVSLAPVTDLNDTHDSLIHYMYSKQTVKQKVDDMVKRVSSLNLPGVNIDRKEWTEAYRFSERRDSENNQFLPSLVGTCVACYTEGRVEK